jgi:DNA-binding beta-propeller fold protein YncE
VGVHPQVFAQQAGSAVATGELPLYPVDVAVNEEGEAFVVDRNLPGVWKWANGSLSVFYQGSPKYRTPLNAPRCVAFDVDGTLLVGDTATMDIYRVAGPGKAEPITGGQIGTPMDIAVARDGTIYVADLLLRKLLKIPSGKKKVEEVADVNPRGVFVDNQQRVWVVSQNAQQLQRVNQDGSVEVLVDKRIFQFPHQLAVASSGEALVTDGYGKAIWKVVEGQPPQIVVQGGPLAGPVGITLMDETPVIVDPQVRKVFQLNDQGVLEEWFEVKRP